MNNKNYQILIVDDEMAYSKGLTKILEIEPYSTRLFYTCDAKFGLIANTLIKAHPAFWKARIDTKNLKETLSRCGVINTLLSFKFAIVLKN